MFKRNYLLSAGKVKVLSFVWPPAKRAPRSLGLLLKEVKIRNRYGWVQVEIADFTAARPGVRVKLMV